MNRLAVAVVAVCLGAAPSFAQSDACAEIDALRALYDVREAMLAAGPESWEVGRRIEHHLDLLRVPLPGGGHRWIRWIRPGSDGPVVRREKLVQADYDAGETERFEAEASVPYAVRIVVPRKRSLLRANNDVWVGTVRIRVAADGEVETIERPIEAWLKPDNSRTFDLGVIADEARVEVETATRAGTRGEALVEVHFPQAVAQDDPANPNAETVAALKRLAYSADPVELDLEIARLEDRLFPGIESVPFATLVTRLREAEALLRSEDEEEREKGRKLLEDIVRLLPR
ncbi:MAG: hypothetical protein ACRD2J_05550 [Thermoanaerobaculia bacterium]